ncbi:MAG TPA: hypothetical protein PKE66_13070, partial [Pyrinomonadaceae bacterium]|nr:hypothetical protein [Pyrinomonadaceae bacterium]
MYQDNEFITAVDLSFAGILQSTKKAKSALQPVFESFTNSLEAIRIRQQNAEAFRPAIRIRIDANKTTLEDSTEFDSLTITDNGIGFNDAEFRRFNTYKLANKGFKNLGSGRIQFVHYFDTATVKSIYAENGRFFERHFVVSKKAQFLERNAIVKHISNRDVESLETGTTIVFRHLLEKSGVYDDLDHNSLKARLLERYSHYFCNRKNELPEITIEFYVASEHLGTSSITPDDIPDPDKTETINLKYSKKNGNLVETTEKTEEFLIQAFKLPEAVLKDNRLALVSKGEVIEDSPVFLESLAEGDVLGGNKYLFLVAGDYIDARDTDVRGTLNIPDKESFSKGLYGDEEILLDDIQSSVNDSIRTMYPEIDQAREQHLKSFQELKEMFLLDDETAKDINIS